MRAIASASVKVYVFYMYDRLSVDDVLLHSLCTRSYACLLSLMYGHAEGSIMVCRGGQLCEYVAFRTPMRNGCLDPPYMRYVSTESYVEYRLHAPKWSMHPFTPFEIPVLYKLACRPLVHILIVVYPFRPPEHSSASSHFSA